MCVCVYLYVALQALFAVMTLKCFLLINVVLSAIVAVLNVGVSSTEKQNANNPFLYSRAASGWHSEKSKWLSRLYHCGCCMEMTSCGISCGLSFYVSAYLSLSFILSVILSLVEIQVSPWKRFWCRLSKLKKKKSQALFYSLLRIKVSSLPNPLSGPPPLQF